MMQIDTARGESEGKKRCQQLLTNATNEGESCRIEEGAQTKQDRIEEKGNDHMDR
jgi:hypothetical protein